MEELYIVRIGEFNEVEKTGFGYRYTVDPNSLKNIICIKDDNYYIDIDTCQSYYELKRTETGLLSEEEYKNINLYEEYALSVNPFKTMDDKTIFDLKKHLKAMQVKHSIKKNNKKVKILK